MATTGIRLRTVAATTTPTWGIWLRQFIPAPAIAAWDGFLFAAPKKKTSHSKKRKRMQNKWLKPDNSLITCLECGQFKVRTLSRVYSQQNPSNHTFTLSDPTRTVTRNAPGAPSASVPRTRRRDILPRTKQLALNVALRRSFLPLAVAGVSPSIPFHSLQYLVPA